MNSFRNRPSWVDEEPLIQSMLHGFLDQIERNIKPLFRVNEKSAPELYDYIDDDPKYLWDLVKTLDNEYHVVTVKKQRSKPGRDSFENAQILLNPDKEGQIRQWLNRPAFDPYTLTWNDYFDKIAHLFEDGGTALEAPLRVEGKTAAEVLQGFALLAAAINTPQTLRNLSAKCFWGDSKFLDDKLELLQKLFSQASHNIQPRPVMMNISLTEDFNEVIFIENLDSFLMMKQLTDKDHRFVKTALVYSSGFKGTSTTIRKRGEVVFSALSLGNKEQLKTFESWWLKNHEQKIHCFFWGDMDYAGLSILAALRKSFPQIEAWQPGFELMLQLHEQGLGHKIRDSKKMQQLDPGTTGCRYADDVLLPAIRSAQRFLDQEVVAYEDLLR